jgi:hypothetical protein
VRIPNGANLRGQRFHPALHPELRGCVRRQELSAHNAGGRGDRDDKPGALPAHDRKGRAGDVDRTEQGGLNLRPELLRGELFEETGVEVARVVDQHIDPAEPVHAGLDGGLGAGGVGDVKSYDDEVVVCAEHGGDLLGVAAGGHDGVTDSQGGLGDVDAHAATGARDEPDILVTHAGVLPSA